MEKLKIPYPVIVEGKYDRIKLESIIDTDIFTTDGFGIFKGKEKTSFFKSLAEKKGKIILLTDSDGGGTVIRSYLKSVIPSENLINLYVPAIQGKEKRKSAPSKEGILGVEGTEKDIIVKLFTPFASDTPRPEGLITKADLFAYGLSGGENAAIRREKLLLSLGLPAKITANALLSAVNALYSKEEFDQICKKL